MNKLSFTIIDEKNSLEVAWDEETVVLLMAPLLDDEKGHAMELDRADAGALGALLTAVSRGRRRRLE